jgi:hypothetical protein
MTDEQKYAPGRRIVIDEQGYTKATILKVHKAGPKVAALLVRDDKGNEQLISPRMVER